MCVSHVIGEQQHFLSFKKVMSKLLLYFRQYNVLSFPEVGSNEQAEILTVCGHSGIPGQISLSQTTLLQNQSVTGKEGQLD